MKREIKLKTDICEKAFNYFRIIGPLGIGFEWLPSSLDAFGGDSPLLASSSLFCPWQPKMSTCGRDLVLLVLETVSSNLPISVDIWLIIEQHSTD